MTFKDLEREKKLFILIGIPSFIFVFYVIISFYVLFLSFYLTIFAVLILGLMKRERIYLRSTKIGVLMVIFFLVQFFNVIHLPGQLIRHAPGGRQLLVDSDHPELVFVRRDFYNWHVLNYGEDFDDLPEIRHEELEIKVKRVDYFIRTAVVEYTSDWQAPYYSFEHVATLDEIFESDTDGDGKLQDDCDGISLLTTSLLISMGYNAYISECLSHWNTIVFPDGSDPTTLEGFKEGIHLYNTWNRPSYYIFNDENLIIPPGRPLSLSFFELFFDGSSYEDEYVGFFQGEIFDLHPIFLLMIVYTALLLASFLIHAIIKIGLPETASMRKGKIKWLFSRKSLNIAIRLSAYGSIIALVIYWLAISGVGFLGTLILSGFFIFIIRYTEYLIISSSEDKKLEDKREAQAID